MVVVLVGRVGVKRVCVCVCVHFSICMCTRCLGVVVHLVFFEICFVSARRTGVGIANMFAMMCVEYAWHT